MPSRQTQEAYEEYSRHQGDKAHNGAKLPVWADVPLENQKAWDAFAVAANAGVPVHVAYNEHYLDALGGKSPSGIEPAWAYFTANRPDIASAWTLAWAAARR